MRLKKKTIGILVGPGYEDLEFWVPYMRMQEDGADVKVIGTKAGEIYISKSRGLTVESHIAAQDISADQLDAVLVPGGWAPDKLRRDRDILRLVRDMNAQEKILGFICHAGWVAASAEICKGKRVTGSTGINFNNRNRVTFRRVLVDNTDSDGINFNSDNRVSITDTTISNVGDLLVHDALNFSTNNTIDINNTTFAGTIAGDVLNVGGANNVINGADNPNNANVGGFVCDGLGNFTGTITIGNQTFVDSAGCN